MQTGEGTARKETTMANTYKRGTCVRCGKRHGETCELYCTDCHVATIRALGRVESSDVTRRLVPILGYLPFKQ